jgi:hypothetical protein
MITLRKAAGTTAVAMLLGLPTFALADSLTSGRFDSTRSPGESTTIMKTITVNKEATTSNPDVLFLADTTGSMVSSLGAVSAGASNSMAGLVGFGDVQFAVGAYKDFGDSYLYNQDLCAVPKGVIASMGPDITGIFDRSIDRTFEIPATFAGVTAGSYEFPIEAMLDGGRVGSAMDAITVSAADPAPEPGRFFLLGIGLTGLGLCWRRENK